MASRAFAPVPVDWPEPLSRRAGVQHLIRRYSWCLRWAFTDRPWRVNFLNGPILVPQSDCGERIYRVGCSDQNAAYFICKFLVPGMTFWDIGAHTGEFSLLAAKALEGEGVVRALEPHPVLFDLLSQNIRGKACVSTSRSAVAAEEGSSAMVVTAASSRLRGALDDAAQEWAPTITLDALAERSARIPNLIKVDVDGAERQVLHPLALLQQHALLAGSDASPSHH